MKKINVLIPMAGAGSRFTTAGYDLPKPLIDVDGKPMIERVIDSLSSNKIETNFIFVAQKDHLDLGLRDYLENRGSIIPISELTEGAACTTLLAKGLIDNDDELVIANCDQYLQWSFYDYIMHSRHYDGCLVTFNSTNPHHSYVKVKKSLVTEVAEKIVISDKASAGIYYFKKGSEYVKSTTQMIAKAIRTNNEFYICPVYNELLMGNKQVSTYEIDVYNKHMLGTPEELQIFLDKVENEEVKL
jgi:NDP-sugar pyrophosphorylase family protein